MNLRRVRGGRDQIEDKDVMGVQEVRKGKGNAEIEIGQGVRDQQRAESKQTFLWLILATSSFSC